MSRLKLFLIGCAFIAIVFIAMYMYFGDKYSVSPLGQIFGSGLVAAVFSQLLIFMKERSRDKQIEDRDRKFIALQLAVTLERYAIECAMRINKISDILEEYYQTRSFMVAIPSMPNLTLPDAVEWRWIETALTSEVLSLAPRISFSEGSIQFILDAAGMHSGAEESQRQLKLMGHDVWMLAEKVRMQHKISPQTYVLGQWEFLDTLKKERS
ncbi:hypothetical protein CNX70_07955 [Janthinobacterium svalbardensis]|uniref:DUF4760 domain-containing protein n=1 Tax=Janthinobacterium svalbardensis TaxID=368607 RepID=A0A290WTB5_9BURK|nr:hypothetical protein [Janthinobacterium svalbardensis]ATD60132.1 hypothetical protein CNX70_07955 [Janthinobacterium svalbardensis]